MQCISLLAGDLLAFQKDSVPRRFNFSDIMPIISAIKFPPLRFFSGSYSEPPLTEETLHGVFAIKKVQWASRALQGAEALYSPQLSSANTEADEM